MLINGTLLLSVTAESLSYDFWTMFCKTRVYRHHITSGLQGAFSISSHALWIQGVSSFLSQLLSWYFRFSMEKKTKKQWYAQKAVGSKKVLLFFDSSEAVSLETFSVSFKESSLLAACSCEGWWTRWNAFVWCDVRWERHGSESVSWSGSLRGEADCFHGFSKSSAA